MSSQKEYKKRIVDSIIARKLKGVGALLVEGPKWCGKTTTCEQFARSVLYMADPERHDQKNILLAETNLSELLDGAQPRLIDEWQEAPQFWHAIRLKVDHEDGWGHYILTGSAVPPNERNGKKKIVHSGTGRIVRVGMRTMSLWESGESSGSVSLSELFAGTDFKISRMRRLPRRRWALLRTT